MPVGCARFELAGYFISAIDLEEIARHIAIERGLFLDTLDDFETRRRHEYLTATAKSFARVAVERHATKGVAAASIVEYAAVDKNILIVCNLWPLGLQRWLLGSVAEKVLHATANPLLLVRAAEGGAADGVQKLDCIIVPLDGSSVAEQVLPLVAEVAKHLDLEVILFRSYNVPYASYYEGGGSYAVDLPQLSGVIEPTCSAILKSAARPSPRLGLVRVTYASQEGLPGDAIIHYARTPAGPFDRHVLPWTLRRATLGAGSARCTVVRHASNPAVALCVRRTDRPSPQEGGN